MPDAMVLCRLEEVLPDSQQGLWEERRMGLAEGLARHPPLVAGRQDGRLGLEVVGP